MVKIIGGKELEAVTAASVPNNSIFLDDADNIIKVKTNSGVVEELGLGYAPVGSITAWVKDLSGTPTLPGNYVECNGQTISDPDSPYDGVTLPDLNAGANRMLRGHTASGVTGGADTHTLTIAQIPAHTHTYTEPVINQHNVLSSFTTGGTTTGTTGSTGGGAAHNNIPAYYSVVWIMRIK